MPDLATLRPVPWLEKTALVLCDLVDEETGDAGRGVAPPDPAAPGRAGRRARLHGQVRRRSSSSSCSSDSLRGGRGEGLRRPRRRTPPVIEDYHILQTTRDEYLIRQIRNGDGRARACPVEFSKGEAGRGQHEINLEYADALEMADRHADLQERRQGDRRR